jgi:DHA3 family tetracycline resistance protein-like MFS transporter
MRRLSAYRIWLVLHFFGSLSGALIFTVAAVYFVRDVGMNPLELVLCGTVMELAVFLFEVPTGVLADTFSRRASVIVGTIVQGAAFVLVGAVQSVPAVLAGYAIWGLGWTFESGALQAWLADEVGPGRLPGIFLRGARMGYAGALLGIGASVAIASSDLGLAIVIGGALNVVLGLFLVVSMPETGFRRGTVDAGESGGLRGLLRTARDGGRVVRARPLLLVILAIAFFSGMWSESFDRLWEAHFLLLGLPSIGGFDPVVWFGVFGAGSMMIGLALTGPAANRLEHARHQTLARVLFAFELFLLGAALLFALAGSFWLALAAYFGIRTARGIASPLFDAWLNQSIEDSRVRATVLSITSQSDAIGQVAGGPALGGIGTVFSIRAALAAGAVALGPSLWLYGRAVRHAAPVAPMEELEADPATV